MARLAAGETSPMILSRSERAEPITAESAVVVDFQAHKARQRELRMDAAAHRAAAALARCEAGRGDWRDVVAALVAPFNP